MGILITNIKELLQVRDASVAKVSGKEMQQLPTLKNAYLLIDGDTIVDYGNMENCLLSNQDTIIDATGKLVLPTWCDSHTHIVYAGNRAQEFVDRIHGLTYEEIANRGGGILNSATTLQQTTEEELYQQAIPRITQIMQMGTGAVEIKSGYGLTQDAELKMLRVINRIKQNFPIKVRRTFLGLHALPKEYKTNKKVYVDLVLNKILPQIAAEELADYIDVFCEKGYFDLEDTKRVLEAGKKYFLPGKIHVNQFHAFGGVAVAVNHNALSVDHLEVIQDDDIRALKNTNTIPVALPTCSYFLSIPYTPARKLLEAGLPLAIASDYNPGSTPSGNMNFVLSTACIKLQLTPEEAINAATINGAYAMGIQSEYGSITKGKKANIIITKKVPNYNYLPYAFGENHIDQVFINGTLVSK